jgi:hypothetical protein
LINDTISDKVTAPQGSLSPTNVQFPNAVTESSDESDTVTKPNIPPGTESGTKKNTKPIDKATIKNRLEIINRNLRPSIKNIKEEGGIKTTRKLFRSQDF